MHNDEKLILGFMAICAVVAFVIFLIYKCCTFLFGVDRPSYTEAYVSNQSASNRLDLHGYGRDAALNKLQEFLYSKRAVWYYATVITGRGLHSPFQRPVLKPAVREWLDGRGYRYDEHDGDFKVYL